MKLKLANLRQIWIAPGALALNVESDRIELAWLRRENGGSRLLQSLALAAGADAILEDPQRVGRELRAALSEAKIQERRCVVCLPPGWALVATTDLPAVTGDDLRSYFELCAERAFPIPVAELHLAHCPYQFPDGRQAATLAALSAKRMKAVEQMLAAAGCRAVSISLGLDRCLSAPVSNAPGALHFLANGRHVDLIITAGGGVVSLRSLPLPPANAKDRTSFDVESMGREIRLTLGRLSGEIRSQIHEACFSGRASSAEVLLAEMREPLGRLGIESIAPDPEAPGPAVGAARRHLLGEPLPFEFVPPQEHRWQVVWKRFDTQRRRWLIAAGFGLVVLPILAFSVRSHQERRLEAEWARIGPVVGELEVVQANVRQFRSWFDATPRSLQIFEGLVAAFPETGDVWAKTIEFREGGRVACAGMARDQASWMAFLDRLRSRSEFRDVQVQQVRGDDPIQFTFTCAWVPTHDD
jgi:hypothetical protein